MNLRLVNTVLLASQGVLGLLAVLAVLNVYSWTMFALLGAVVMLPVIAWSFVQVMKKPSPPK